MYGENATAHIFTSFPRDDLSKTTGFFDIFTGCGLLTGTTCMLIDPNNAKTASGVIPLSLVFLLYGILMSFGFQTGAPINLTIDFSGRFFTYCAGYGSEVFSRGDYWFWVPPVACVCGTIAFVTTYQLMIGNHLPMDDEDDNDDNEGTVKSSENRDGFTRDLNHFSSKDSINTNDKYITENTKI